MDFQMDPHLIKLIEQGKVTRCAIDFYTRKITIWYKDHDLALELERQMSLYEHGILLKKDYSFDVSLTFDLKGAFVLDNQMQQDNYKAEFVFDFYKNFKVENTDRS